MRFFWILPLLALIVGWAASAQAAPPSGSIVTHPNGLQLELPPGYRAIQVENGFIVEEHPPVARRDGPVRITVVTAKREGSALNGQRRIAGGKAFQYTVEEGPVEGSIGKEFSIRACREEGDRALCLWQFRHAKHSEPEFELWAIAAGASLR